MRIAIRNYRRIERADIELSPICLVAGQNGAGKTSLFQAAAAALTRKASPMGLAKKDAAAIVLRGTESGSARIIAEGGAAGVAWPSCETSAEGTAPPSATPFAAGLLSIVDLKPEERAKALAGYVNSAPTVTDLYASMNDAGYTDEGARKAWANIEAGGWDAVHRSAMEFGATLKGQWEGVTGERWGSAKAAAWTPAGWTDELASADPSSLQREIAEAKAGLEGCIASTAVSAAELERLRAEAASGDPAGLEAAQINIAVTEAALKDAEKARDELPPAVDGGGVPCPKCGTHLVADLAWKDRGRPQMAGLKIAEEIPEAELTKRRHAVAVADGTVENKRGSVATARTMLADAQRRAATAEAARAKLAEIATASAQGGGTSADEVEAKRQALAQAEAALAMVTAKLNAAKIHTTIARNLLLIDILAPDGLRKKKLAAGLDGFNAELATLCSAAGWPAVRLDENLEAWFGAEPYWNCSESQQMRVRVTLQLAMALADQSDAVLIDRADMLDQKGRNGLFGLLQAAGVRALVLMTVNKPDLVPPLAKAGLGHSYWLDGGAVAEIGQAEARAAA